MRRTLSSLLAVALLAVCPLAASAQNAPKLVTLVDNGDPKNRIDLVILGDGYRASEMAKFAADVSVAVEGLFAQEPFATYKTFFNVHRVEVASKESGADHQEDTPPVLRDTAFGASYGCGGIERLICVDSQKVNTALAQVTTPVQRDLVLVLVNDPEYGGSGGAISVASTHPSVVELVLHENGHTIGLLADEYSTPVPGGDAFCMSSAEPSQANTTKATALAKIKWKHWIEPETPIPTPTGEPGVPGLYEGSSYCTRNVYRPTNNSKMRTLGPPFEQINSEQLVRRFYNYVSPLDGVFPATKKVKIAASETAEFSVTVPTLASPIEVTWYVDGQVAGVGTTLSIPGTSLSKGKHLVEVVAQDMTPLVRSDPEELLVERRVWKLKVK